MLTDEGRLPPEAPLLRLYRRDLSTSAITGLPNFRTVFDTVHISSSSRVMFFEQKERALSDLAERNLAFHRAEIARLTERLAITPPHTRRAGLLRTTLRYHHDMVARSGGDAARGA